MLRIGGSADIEQRLGRHLVAKLPPDLIKVSHAPVMLQNMPPELKRMVIVQVYNSRSHADMCEDAERGRVFAEGMKVGLVQRRLDSSV
jgi:hypothetical protein